jgi:hypothetical protein
MAHECMPIEYWETTQDCDSLRHILCCKITRSVLSQLVLVSPFHVTMILDSKPG